jgi:hypothetical protein
LETAGFYGEFEDVELVILPLYCCGRYSDMGFYTWEIRTVVRRPRYLVTNEFLWGIIEVDERFEMSMIPSNYIEYLHFSGPSFTALFGPRASSYSQKPDGDSAVGFV